MLMKVMVAGSERRLGTANPVVIRSPERRPRPTGAANRCGKCKR